MSLIKPSMGGKGHLLRSVNIRDRAEVKNSQNLNGNGYSDQTITTADMEAAGKATLLDVIEKKVKGFREGYIPRSRNLYFLLHDKRVHFVIDGIDIERFYQPTGGGPGFLQIPNEHYQYQKDIVDYITAEDVLGIEVLSSSAYVSTYNTRNLTVSQLLANDPTGPTGSSIAYIEITTRSGKGPFFKAGYGNICL